DRSTDKRSPITQIITKGLNNITYSHNGQFIAYVNGDNKVKHREFCYLGPHLLDYRQDQSEGRTYMVVNYKNKKEDAVKPLKLISKDNNSIFYTRDLVKDNFFVAYNGKHIDYKKARFEYLDNGDPVIFIDDIPKFVLTGFKNASNFIVQKGQPYNNELPVKSSTTNTSNTTTPSNTTNYTCKKGDCKNGWGQTDINGIVVDGTFKNGALHGLAYVSYPNGAYYHGEYKNNFREGMGYYKFDNGNTYVGYWKNGKQHGYGITFNSNGNITSAGEFENGKLIKNMASDYLNHIKSSNYCQGNCTDGFGQYTYGNGDTYLGFFKNNQRYSVGTYNWTNNSKFTGAYTLGGTRSGYGMYTYVDQSVFKGFFINDKIDGLGVMKYNKTGSVVYGVFNNKGAKIKDY
ncbi:MAG: MORN motif precursor, partial [Algicola sp.]|nr:MORN motif precursor [Algicola sp.]